MERTVSGPVPFTPDLTTPESPRREPSLPLPTWPMRGVSQVAIRVICAVVLLHSSAAFGRRAAAQPVPEASALKVAQDPVAGSSPCPGVPCTYSDMVTNRESPWATTRLAIVPAPPGSLAFYTASGAYRSDFPRVR
jgi:hypothetical protein